MEERPASSPAGSATATPQPADSPDPAEATAPGFDVGVAGASARKEYERRHAKREKQIDDTWGTGRIGRIAKFLSDDPQSTKAWAQGAKGEERLARRLHQELGDSAVLLHDRKVPKTRGNIDHLVVAASGVWVVDAKRYKGKVEKRDVGGFFKTDLRLYVGGRDRTKAVVGMEWQRTAVHSALGDLDVPVHCALSFVDAEWPLLFARPFQLQDVWISWPKKLAELINQGHSLDAESVNEAARRLSETLPSTPA